MSNVLLVMVDEMAWWALGHVTPGIHTPNIDRLAARSMRFSQAYTPSPICVPTRAAIATGRYLNEIGNWSSAEPYDGSVRGWAHAVRDAGHDCVSIGKLHYRSTEDDAGFAEQIEPIHIVGGVGWVRGLLRKPLCDYGATRELAEDIGPGDTDYHAFDRRVAEAACAWLSQPARKTEPWCAFVSFLSPHYPLIAPAADYARYDPAEFEAEAQPVPDHPILREMWEFWDHDRFFTPKTRGIAHAGYRGLCSFVDAQVGKVLDALAAAGLEEDTTILFTSDHGDMMGEKGFWVKSTMYDSSARVPLLMAGPGIAPGDWDAPVSLIDLAATVCGVMGVSGGGGSGRDLRDPDPGRAVISEYHDGGCPVGMTMLRWGVWKLVHFAEGHPAQLFHMQADPGETDDLSGARPDIMAEGMRILLAMLDPEAVNIRAHADQARRVIELGGREALLAMEQWNYTPADSR
ncbi:MAG: sulfatase-like hydrolase/transferase [Aestuariivita sp.]|uniref:sulfatase-like hydrolase/transferase n=1 Tax=Aestuariivita sp. TaxID=1872407 RepID=UPI003BB1065D